MHSLEISGTINPKAQRDILEDLNYYQHHCENFVSRSNFILLVGLVLAFISIRH